MVATLLEALSGADGEASLIERLDALPFDEMAEVDVAGNMI